MLRLRFPGGSVTAAQLRLAAKITAEKGRGFADLTTRQEIRVDGIRPEDQPDILGELEAAGIQAPVPGEFSQDPAGCPLAAADPAEYFESGVHEQKEPELFAIGVPILAGRIEADSMRKVADLAERYADGSLHLTPRQNLMFKNVPKERVAQILEGLESVRLSARASAAARALVLCPSGESGGRGESDVTRLAKDMVEHLDRRVPMDQPFTIHMSGWAGGCVHHEVAEIGLQGSRHEADGRAEETFDVWIGGRSVVRQIPADQLHLRMEQLLVGYKRSREPGEALGDFCARAGGEAVNQLLSEPVPEVKPAN